MGESLLGGRGFAGLGQFLSLLKEGISDVCVVDLFAVLDPAFFGPVHLCILQPPVLCAGILSPRQTAYPCARLVVGVLISFRSAFTLCCGIAFWIRKMGFLSLEKYVEERHA